MEYVDKELLIKKLETDEKYRELLIEIKNGNYDIKDYETLCQNFIGKELNDFFCNGFFGSDTYDLEDARITQVFKSDTDCIKIEVKKVNGEYDYGYFEDGWCDWETVYEHLNKWVYGEN